MVLDKIYFCCKMEKRNYIEWEKIILRAPPNQREYCRAERIRRGSEFFYTCRLMGALSDPSLYSIVLLADRWSGPARALSPYRKQSPNSQCSFLASFWPKGGARWNALPARRARTQRTEYQASNRRSETKHHPRRLSRTVLARFLCLSLVLAFAGQEWDRSGGIEGGKEDGGLRVTGGERGGGVGAGGWEGGGGEFICCSTSWMRRRRFVRTYMRNCCFRFMDTCDWWIRFIAYLVDIHQPDRIGVLHPLQVWYQRV